MSLIESNHLDEGVKIIGKFFNRAFLRESIDAIRPEAIKEPSKALMKAMDRVYAEFEPRDRFTMQKFLEILQQEGRKVRQDAAKTREDDWNREKGADASGRVEGDPLGKAARSEEGKLALKIINGILNDAPKEKITKGLGIMAERYPHTFWPKLHRHYDLHGGLESCHIPDAR